MKHIKGFVERDLEKLVKSAIEPAESVLDIGCGIGKFLQFTSPNQRVIGVEPHFPYIEEAKKIAPWAEFRNTDALSFFTNTDENFDCVLLIDVVEHLPEKDATKMVELAKSHCKEILFSFIPYGIHLQTEDAWGKEGEYWQTHRSTWDETNIDALDFSYWTVWKGFFREHLDNPQKTTHAMIGIWMPQFDDRLIAYFSKPSLFKGKLLKLKSIIFQIFGEKKRSKTD